MSRVMRLPINGIYSVLKCENEMGVSWKCHGLGNFEITLLSQMKMKKKNVFEKVNKPWGAIACSLHQENPIIRYTILIGNLKNNISHLESWIFIKWLLHDIWIIIIIILNTASSTSYLCCMSNYLRI